MSMGFRGDENALKLNSGDLINLFMYLFRVQFSE